jgi:hypothetical protein
MDRTPQFTRRVITVAILLALLMGCMGATMYNLQIVRGDEFYEQSQRKIAETLGFSIGAVNKAVKTR